MDTRQARTSATALAVCFATAAAIASTAALAQQLPPGATPGAVLPRLAAALASSAGGAGEVLSIPPVADRPVGKDEGPKLLVRSFKLAGVSGTAGHGISEADARRVLDGALSTEPADGYTVNQLQALAGKVADYYHGKGLILAQAFVPAQEVHDNQVTVQVLEGRLSGITIEGNKSYSKRTLLRPFNPLLGGPVDKDSIEAALLTVTNYPGVTAFGILGAGHDVGTTNLTLKVTSERRITFETTVDNHGSQFAGEYRGQAAVAVNDLFGDADRLRLYGLYGFDSGDSNAHGFYGGFNYEIPLFSPRDSLLLSFASNDYNIGKVTPEILATHPKGRTNISEAGYRHDLPRSRFGSASFGVALDVKRGTFQENGADFFKDNLTTGRVFFDWDRVDTRFHGVNQLEVAYVRGFKSAFGAMGDYNPAATVPASRLGASGQFGKATLNIQRLQRITTNSSLLLRVQGQTSSDPLVSLEQMPLGGPDAVRGYTISDALVEKGVVATAELIFGAPGFASRPAFANRTWGQILQFSVFGDYGHGTLNTPIPPQTPDHFNLGAWGGAIQLNVPSKVFLRVDVAKPTSSLVPVNGRDPQYYFRLGFSF